MLDRIVASNTLDFTLSEIEGDAALFYRKGEPIALDSVMHQCLTMCENFHQQLKLIERDTVYPSYHNTPQKRKYQALEQEVQRDAHKLVGLF